MKYKVKHIHFVGIGGAGMSGIAEVLLNLGYQVSGSDLSANTTIKRLQKLGAQIFAGHAAENIQNADVIVVSTAIAETNPEVVAAREKHLPVVPRAMMLAELMRLKSGIAIAGTHGKTTTTSLVTSILAEGGFDPTFVIGGRLNSAGANARLGSGEFIVVEADESDASFLNLSPVIEIITNIDHDHMETYDHDFAKLKKAFVDFIGRLPFYGLAIICIDDPVLQELLPHLTKPVLTYGLDASADLRAHTISAKGRLMQFTVSQKGYADLSVELNQPGMHNVQNACAAIAVAREIGVADTAIQKALKEFHGVGRRFTDYGQMPLLSDANQKFQLIDDYGHHPVEMQATLNAARMAFPGKRIVLAFQPHRYTRTRDLFEDFVKVLSQVDKLLLTEVYSAGENPIVAADGRSLARAVRVVGQIEPIFVEHIEELQDAIFQHVSHDDVVILMGAGSIGQVAQQFSQSIQH